jgi:undecaprenyl-diphosphatase
LSRPRFPKIPVPAVLEPLDARADEWFERALRSRPGVDAVMYAASSAGDHGIVWLGLAALQAARLDDGRRRFRLVRAAGGLGIESLLVNGPVKLMFRRTRPIFSGTRPMHLRTPRTSSFPSGHATAAFFGAALLRDGDGAWPLYYALAVVVSASRVHVRIHHASDVVAGALLGIALGEATRRLVPLPLTVSPGRHRDGGERRPDAEE